MTPGRPFPDLVETMRDADGAGLAAIQVYEPVRICAIEVRDNPRYPYKPKIPLTILVNPVLTPVGEERFGNYEGCLSVPNLRGHDAQILTACGISHRDELAAAHAEPLLKKVDAFVMTPAGERILRGGERPDLKEVTNWIAWANQPQRAKAA